MKPGIEWWVRTAHNWAGLTVSLILAVIALSGSLLVWKGPWLKLVQPGAAAGVQPDASASGQAAEAAEAAFGAAGVKYVNLAGPEFGLHEVALTAGGGAYLDPATGRVVALWGENERLVDWLFDLHHHLLMGETGTLVAGWAGFAGLLLTLTGLYLWWPTRRLFSPRVLPRSTGRAHLLAVHRDLGALAAPVLVVLLFTGWAVAVPKASKPILAVLAGQGAPPASPPRARSADVDWVGAVTAAQARFPDAAPRLVVWPAADKPALIRLRQPSEWHSNGRTQVFIEPATGQVTGIVDAQRQARADRFYNSFWPVHAGRVGGWVWRTLLTAAGLALFALSLFGAEAYRQRLFGKRKARRRAAPLSAPSWQAAE